MTPMKIIQDIEKLERHYLKKNYVNQQIKYR